MENMTCSTNVGRYIIAIALLGYLGYRHTRSAEDFMIREECTPLPNGLQPMAPIYFHLAIVGLAVPPEYGLRSSVDGLHHIGGRFIAFVFYGRKPEVAHGLGIKTFPEMLGIFRFFIYSKIFRRIANSSHAHLCGRVMIGGTFH